MPDRLGRYVIEGEIGKGGMGVVYRARDERLGKIVAVKVLLDAETVGSEARIRLRREAQAAAILNHPAIASAYDYDEQNGTPFIVYEYVEGKSLDLVIAEEKLSPAKIAGIAGQIAAGLAYAHERGILHRDIKPQNIMVTSEGQVKILDFGLAKRTSLALVRSNGQRLEGTTVETVPGTIVGTVQYMSPEQITGEMLDGRTDIFSTGILIYEMASGKNPFEGRSFGSTVGKILSLDPPPVSAYSPEIPQGLQEIINRCLKKSRDERYPSARMLRDDLEKLRASASSPQEPDRYPGLCGALIPRAVARLSLVLLQILYLGIYGAALYHHGAVFTAIAQGLAFFSGGGLLKEIGTPRLWTTAFLVTGCCGIPVRLYLIASVGFDDPETGLQFRKLFPALLMLDEIWALSPFLLLGKWPPGLTLICVVLLAYLPFTHRNLIRNAYVTEARP